MMRRNHHALVVALVFGLVLVSCAKRDNASPEAAVPERTTVGNGGHDTLVLFRGEATNLLEGMLNSFEATQFAKESDIDLAWLKSVAENDDSGVDIVISKAPLYDHKGGLVKATAIEKNRLELDGAFWEAALINPSGETKVLIIHELLRLHPKKPDNFDDGYGYSRELFARRSQVSFEWLTPETKTIDVQIANRNCPAAAMQVAWRPSEKMFSMQFLYGDEDRVKNRYFFRAMRPLVQCAVRFRADPVSMIGKLVATVETHEMSLLPTWGSFLDLKITQPTHATQYRTTVRSEQASDAPAVQLVARTLSDFVQTQKTIGDAEGYIVSVESTAYEKGFILPAKLELHWK